MSAFYDFFCLGKKFLIYNLVSRNLKSKYHRSVLGLFWTLLSPLAMAGIYFLVFNMILNVQIPYYLPFILSGVLPWTFFSQTVLEGMESIAANAGIATKVPVPLQVFPFSGALTNLVTLGFSFPIVLGASLLMGAPVGLSLILAPLPYMALFLLAYSYSVLLAVAFIYFRDLRHLMGIAMQIWFYSTPVLYQESMIPEGFRWLIYANPVGPIFVTFHDIFVRGTWPEPAILTGMLLWTTSITLFTLMFQQSSFSGVVERI